MTEESKFNQNCFKSVVDNYGKWGIVYLITEIQIEKSLEMCNIQFTTVLLYILYGSRKKTCLIVFPRTVSAHVLTYAVWEGGLHLLLNLVFAVGSVGIMSVRTSPCRNLHLPEYLIMSLYFMYYFIDLACVYI